MGACASKPKVRGEEGSFRGRVPESHSKLVRSIPDPPSSRSPAGKAPPPLVENPIPVKENVEEEEVASKADEEESKPQPLDMVFDEKADDKDPGQNDNAPFEAVKPEVAPLTDSNSQTDLKLESMKPEPIKTHVESAKPEPVKRKPKPIEPGPIKTNIESATPEPVKKKPELVEPKPIKTHVESTNLDPVKKKPEPTEPKPIKTHVESTKPEPIKRKPEPIEPKPIKTHVESTNLDPVKKKPEPNKPEPIKTHVESTKSELVKRKPEPIEPEPMKTPVESTKPEPVKKKPEPIEYKPIKTHVESTNPEPIEPDPIKTHVESTKPEPVTSKPEPIEPESKLEDKSNAEKEEALKPPEAESEVPSKETEMKLLESEIKLVECATRTLSKKGEQGALPLLPNHTPNESEIKLLASLATPKTETPPELQVPSIVSETKEAKAKPRAKEGISKIPTTPVKREARVKPSESVPEIAGSNIDSASPAPEKKLSPIKHSKSEAEIPSLPQGTSVRAKLSMFENSTPPPLAKGSPRRGNRTPSKAETRQSRSSVSLKPQPKESQAAVMEEHKPISGETETETDDEPEQGKESVLDNGNVVKPIPIGLRV